MKYYFLIMIVLGFFSCQKEIPHEVVSTEVDVYVAGYEYDGSGGSISVAKYWKNGQAITLPVGTSASSIAIVGSDVYVAGYGYNGAVSVAKYWKNGVAISLTDGTNNANSTSIFVVKR